MLVTNWLKLALLLSALLIAATILMPTLALACTRAVYVGEEEMVITGRSMDWKEDIQPDLWVFPRGISRDGGAGDKSIRWTSKYGSVAVAGYNAGTADGMNEVGLVANLLYLAESDYGKIDLNNPTPILSISLWLQYVLDNFATVAEAVDALAQNPFQLSAPLIPNGSPAQLHLAISDPTGDSAIFEYIDGELVIHHSREYRVMTNSPQFSHQLALDDYWREIGGLVFLPGTNRAADRFVRASFFIEAIPKKIDPNYMPAIPNQTFTNQAVASVGSVMRSVSVPLGITTPDRPNLSSTIFRTVADQKNKTYFFDSATSPNTFWVVLADLDFSENAPVKKLPLANGAVYSGNVAAKFEAAQPFVFIPAVF